MPEKNENRSFSTWSEAEREYRDAKQDVLRKTPSQDVAEAPFVFADRQLVSTILTRIDMFRSVIDVKGSVVECGVHRANSLYLYYHLSSILEPYAFNRKIIGFDTFAGFRSLSDKDDERLSEDDFSDTSFELLSKMHEVHDCNRSVSHLPKMELVKGDATITIPKYVEDNPHLIIAMLYLDFDIYEPTSIALKYLLPLVPKGGLVGFDELNSKKWSGETVAFKEAINISGVKLKKFYYDPWVSYYMVE